MDNASPASMATSSPKEPALSTLLPSTAKATLFALSGTEAPAKSAPQEPFSILSEFALLWLTNVRLGTPLMVPVSPAIVDILLLEESVLSLLSSSPLTSGVELGTPKVTFV